MSVGKSYLDVPDHIAEILSDTPWGRAQDITPMWHGVYSVCTAGHGGIYLEKEHADKIPECLKQSPYNPRGPEGGHWFEEDCGWLIAAAYVPIAFMDELRLNAPRIKQQFLNHYGTICKNHGINVDAIFDNSVTREQIETVRSSHSADHYVQVWFKNELKLPMFTRVLRDTNRKVVVIPSSGSERLPSIFVHKDDAQRLVQHMERNGNA